MDTNKLQTAAATVRDETTEAANTAQRVGTLLIDIISGLKETADSATATNATLSQKVDKEVSDRKAADTQMQATLDNLGKQLGTEASARLAGDQSALASAKAYTDELRKKHDKDYDELDYGINQNTEAIETRTAETLAQAKAYAEALMSAPTFGGEVAAAEVNTAQTLDGVTGTRIYYNSRSGSFVAGKQDDAGKWTYYALWSGATTRQDPANYNKPATNGTTYTGKALPERLWQLNNGGRVGSLYYTNNLSTLYRTDRSAADEIETVKAERLKTVTLSETAYEALAEKADDTLYLVYEED